jgi:hypothetical protein
VSRYIDEHRTHFGVEPICRALGVSASASYERASGKRSARALEDERLLAVIRVTHKQNYEAYGYRRTWKALRRAGEQVPRCQVQRLMAANGIRGAKRRAKPWRTTTPDPLAHRRPDLVNRDFTAWRPDALWLADFSYLRCWEGLVFFSFVIDAFSRRVVGWQFASHMRTDLVLDALGMALGTREPGADVALVHHSDRGSQGGFRWSSQRSMRRCRDGPTERLGFGDDGAAGDAFAGAPTGGAAGGSCCVLAGGRWRRSDCRCGPGGWGVRGGWCPLVSGRWRDTNCHSGPVVGALPVVRGEGGDCVVARPEARSARDRKEGREIAVDDLP